MADQPVWCTACRRAVDLAERHVTIVVQVEQCRDDGIHVLATNVLGHWHKPCARSWPVPEEINRA